MASEGGSGLPTCNVQVLWSFLLVAGMLFLTQMHHLALGTGIGTESTRPESPKLEHDTLRSSPEQEKEPEVKQETKTKPTELFKLNPESTEKDRNKLPHINTKPIETQVWSDEEMRSEWLYHNSPDSIKKAHEFIDAPLPVSNMENKELRTPTSPTDINKDASSPLSRMGNKKVRKQLITPISPTDINKEQALKHDLEDNILGNHDAVKKLRLYEPQDLDKLDMNDEKETKETELVKDRNLLSKDDHTRN